MSLKTFTNYACPNDTGLGHSGVYTGAHADGSEHCICGEKFVEESANGDCKVQFETISPHVAATMEARFGKDVWPTLSDNEWNKLQWYPVTSEGKSDRVLRNQYNSLLRDAQSKAQPIRNVKMFRRSVSEWAEVEP